MVARRGASHLPSSQEPKRPLRRKPAPDQHGKESLRHGLSGNSSNAQPNPQSKQAASSTQTPPSRPNSVVAFSDYREATYSAAAEARFQRQRSQQNRTKGFEALVVIAVNVFLSAAAVIALTKLWPYQTVQKERLDAISTEVNSAEQRVNALRTRLPETFGSGKSQEIFLRKQGWINQNQTSVKLFEPGDIASPGGEMLPSTSTAQKPNAKTPPATPSVP
jgi:hypothetical protein